MSRERLGHWVVICYPELQDPIHFEFWPLLRETPQGAWFNRPLHGETWKKWSTTSWTQEDALESFWHKKRAHVRHARRRLLNAEAQWEIICEKLGRDASIPKSLDMRSFSIGYRE